MRIKIKIIEVDAECKAEGYKDAILSKGKIEGDFVQISAMDYTMTRNKFPSIRPNCGTVLKGLGDVVERFAQPIAKAIDKVAGTHIQSCGGCQKRKQILNELVPFK